MCKGFKNERKTHVGSCRSHQIHTKIRLNGGGHGSTTRKITPSAWPTCAKAPSQSVHCRTLYLASLKFLTCNGTEGSVAVSKPTRHTCSTAHTQPQQDRPLRAWQNRRDRFQRDRHTLLWCSKYPHEVFNTCWSKSKCIAHHQTTSNLTLSNAFVRITTKVTAPSSNSLALMRSLIHVFHIVQIPFHLQ